MRIKELNIKAFGRFWDKKIVLDNGLNIVYGLNEKGKSTIHSFIEAMLFGFAKPGVKRRVLMEEYELYRPWTGQLYEGSLVYQTGDRTYKVERNMLKGNESVRVFDHVSGQEVTREFGYHKARKELLFARQHLGINRTIYRNTISICQMGNKSDAGLAGEIQTRLGNLSTSGDMGLSVGKAEKLIKEYLDGIGTDRAYSREYGRLCRQIGRLEEELEASAAAVEDLRTLQRQLWEAEAKAEEFKADRAEIESKIKDYEDSLLQGRWEDIQRLREDRQNLVSQLESSRGYGGFDTKDSQELFTLDRLVVQDRGEIMKIRAKIEETSLDIAGLTGEISGPNSRDTGGKRGPVFYRRRLGSSYLLCLLSLLAAIAAAAMGISGKPVLYGLMVPLLAFGVFFLRRAGKYKSLLKEQERAHEKLGLEQQYMERYRDDLYRMISDKEQEQKKREERIKTILARSGAVSVEDYREKLEGYGRFKQLQSRLEETDRLLDVRLDGETFEGLRTRAGGMDKGMAKPPAGYCREGLEECRDKLEIIKEGQSGLMGSIQKTRGSIEVLQESLADLPGMEEELSKARERKEQLDKEREAAQTALEIIREASSEVHRGFAPMLNRRVGEIAAQITEGRYTDLRVTGDLEIFATAPETGRQVRVDLLSGGAADQFYFACRMAASDLLSGDKNLPLFLDDSFVQYDIHRLERVMEYLIQVSKTRQIIIFTCHNREKEVADRLGGVYNYLKIE